MKYKILDGYGDVVETFRAWHNSYAIDLMASAVRAFENCHDFAI